VTPLIAACLSSLGTIAAIAQTDRLPTSRDELEAVLEPCRMAIVLVGIDGTRVSRTIDAMTGGLGWSHCYFDPCRRDAQGRRRVIGYTVAKGVHWADPATYKNGRKHARIELDATTGAEVWGCVRTRIGRPLRVSALVLGVPSAATCVGLVVGCLPWRIQERLRAMQKGPCISPNTLAAFYGVGPG